MQEEAKKLRALFTGLKRAAFARKTRFPGGPSMIYQHITGRRPISVEAAIAYAKGFGCSLDEISPRLAAEALNAASHTSGRPDATSEQGEGAAAQEIAKEPIKPPPWMQPEAFRLLELYYTLDQRRREDIMDDLESMSAKAVANSGNAIVGHKG